MGQKEICNGENLKCTAEKRLEWHEVTSQNHTSTEIERTKRRETVSEIPPGYWYVGRASDWLSGGREFDPRRIRRHSFMEIDHETFSTVIPSIPLIQEGQLSVSGERVSTKTG